MQPGPSWCTYRLPLVQQPEARTAAPPRAAEARDELLLLQNVRWFCALRWLVVGALFAILLAGALAGPSLQRHGIRLETGWPAAAAACLALLNLGYLAVVRAAARSPRRGTIALRCLWLQILLDLAVLTVVVHYLGSLDPFAPWMYLFHIVLACIFFPYAQSLLVTFSAMAMFAACVALETAGVIAPRSLLTGPLAMDRSVLPWEAAALRVGSVTFISLTVWYLASRLARALRERDDQLAAANRRLLAATDKHARRMLRTTHQFKAPFAAIHANAHLLLGGYCGPISERAAGVVGQISNRCEMLSRQIKAMLQLANLRSSAQNAPSPMPVDLCGMIEASVAALRPTAARRGVRFEEHLAPATVRAVPDHVVMMIENVLSNGVAYSRDGGTVTVACGPGPEGGARIEVRDEGIGIAPEKLPHVFEDFFRTTEAARHNSQSTGLGLAIVREAALAGRIAVCVESALDQGTLVTLDFPPVPPG